MYSGKKRLGNKPGKRAFGDHRRGKAFSFQAFPPLKLKQKLQHVNNTSNERRKKRSIAPKTNGFEQNRCIKHDHVHASELLKHGNAERKEKLGPILPFKYV